jgi:hypothetical protein
VSVGVATGVSVGGTGVSVGGAGVSVGGEGVSVGGSGVSVGATGVSVGGTGVSVGLMATVAVGGTGVIGVGFGPQADSKATVSNSAGSVASRHSAENFITGPSIVGILHLLSQAGLSADSLQVKATGWRASDPPASHVMTYRFESKKDLGRCLISCGLAAADGIASHAKTHRGNAKNDQPD